MNKFQSKIIFFLYLSFFVIGVLIFKDFGIGLEESFQKASGFYWLTFLFDLINLESLKIISENKYSELYSLNPNLPRVENNPAYGIILDLPIAFFEIIINFEKNAHNIYLKHFFNFFIFFVSSIYFGKILYKRFSNFYVIFFGSIAYFLTPKIFGASFFDGKDLFFLSIFTITIYYFQNYLNKKTLNALFIFSIFSALSTSSRVFGLLIPISFLLILFFELLCKNSIKENLKTAIIYVFSYFVFLFIHWPFLWNFSKNKINFLSGANVKVFFKGNYYDNLILPISYIPKLISISTPIFLIFLFFFGFFLILKRLYFRLIDLDKYNIQRNPFDLWRGKKEQLDFLLILCFGLTLFSYLIFNVKLYSSWRHFLFLHFFIVYFSSSFIFYFSYKLKRKFSYFFYAILFFFNLEMIFKSYILHPFQYNYFNNTISKSKKLLYERDTAHLSRVHALQDIMEDIKNEKKLKVQKIGTASWSPLEDVLFMFPKEDLNKIKLSGTNDLNNADYIYTNYIYELNLNYSSKYKIPKNFNLFKSVYKNDTLMYSIFKKQ